MGTRRRQLAAFLVVAAFGVLLAVVFGRASGSSPNAAKASVRGPMGHASVRERAQGEGEGADAEAYSDRAYPSSEITIDQIQGAIAANAKLAKKTAKLGSKWDSIGPDTLNVDRLGTQSFIKATQWSGRVSALAISPTCVPDDCTVYVGAAGGGVWRSKNALAPKPAWKQITGDIPTNSIGSIAVDPNDASGNTIYVGTGEANASSDSAAGLGLYKTTDGGNHWALVQGSFAVANNRSIAWVAVDPADANHLLIGTRSGARGMGSNASSGGTVAAQSPAVGAYETHDGGATWALGKAGSVNEVKFDPSNSHVVYAAVAGTGLVRSTNGAPWETIFSGTRSRYSFAPVVKDGKTRIYLVDASGGGQGAQVYRIDDASQPAAVLTAGSNAAWTRLSNPAEGTPGFAVYNYCNTPLVGSQCSYDMFVNSPADRPDMVVVGGLMHYEELKPYAAPGGVRSNGRAVLMSMDAGSTWTDVTGDVGGESMHPDQHALVFVPGNPDQFFEASDGGVIRSSGQWADASSQCDSRGLSPAFLTDCHN
ncbi:MAG: hypothetical protein QOH23_2691, partial [Gaiellaceae bacterium]|nr:hypothetical protein [Gaiellaceae bacterium]